MSDISVIIIAKNEAEMIGDCIDSLKAFNLSDILVFDDGSTDETVSIAQFKGATVYNHTKQDFAEMRNYALKKARGRWVLYIDADERLSQELVHKINEVTLNSTGAAYSFWRRNYYLGVRWPTKEVVTRLFKKEKLQGWFGPLHESPMFDGECEHITADLLHYTHRSLEAMIEKTIVWSAIEAKLRFDNNHPAITWWRIPRVMVPVFFDFYITQGGWKVGTAGLIESIYQAFSIFITYARLWELQQKSNYAQ